MTTSRPSPYIEEEEVFCFDSKKNKDPGSPITGLNQRPFTMKPQTNSSDDDYEEEEFIVFADFQSKVAPEALTDPNLNLKLIGMDSDTPIMQINSKVFQGKCSTSH